MSVFKKIFKSLLNLILAVYFWFVVVSIGGFICIYARILNFISKYIYKIKNVDLKIHRLSCIWGWSLFKLIPRWKLVVFGKENIVKSGKSLVYVANHESMTDIWTVFALGFYFKWMAKQELFNIPILGKAMYISGYIPIMRGSKDSTKKAIAASEKVLDERGAMMMFPEGTRSKDEILTPFKNGAFMLAKNKEVDIIPIVLRGTSKLLTKGSFIPGISTVYVSILPKVDQSRFNDYEELKGHVYNIMSDELERLKKM